MNPWMSEQLGAAHRDELRRVAAIRRYPSADRPGQPEGRVVFARTVRHARRYAGALLIRAGGRLGGPDAFSRPLPSA